MKSKSNKIYLLEGTPEDVYATHVFAFDNIKRIIKPDKQNLIPSFIIWISREEDLHSFTYQIPVLAWELIEYADEPLNLVYPHSKYDPLREKPSQPIGIRLVKDGLLHDFIKKHGPLFTTPKHQSKSIELLDNSCVKFKGIIPHYERVKTMKLFSDGSFTFLR